MSAAGSSGITAQHFDRARAHFIAGVEAFEASRYEDAEREFNASLELVPGRVSTLANLASTLIRLDRPEDALKTLDSIADSGNSADPLRHRGVALHHLGRYDEALACYDRVIAMEPANARAWYHRAGALDALERWDDALRAIDKVIAIEPANGDAWLRRGQILQWLHRFDSALTSYRQSTALDPARSVTWTCEGILLRDMGRLGEAARCFREALERGGDSELNNYLLASVTEGEQSGPPVAAPRSYVQQLFDGYASEFENHLVGVLQYHGHESLVAQLKELIGGRRFARALDLGCGTGLCGKLIADACDVIDGVDLSQGMLERAAELGLYRRLAQGDVVDFLRDVPAGRSEPGADPAPESGTYDLVISGDVFIYLGDLAPVFDATRAVIEPGGIFCFSTERADDAHDYELRASSRFGHSERYVRALATQHGFETVSIASRHLRNEKHQSIEGLFAYLRAPG
jgi:predicted TPR repeat methyltransferase